MIELVEPYVYVHAITVGLGTLWTVQALLRLRRFARRWSSRLALLGASEPWLRSLLLVSALRATIFDPINLALMAILVGIWELRAFL